MARQKQTDLEFATEYDAAVHGGTPRRATLLLVALGSLGLYDSVGGDVVDAAYPALALTVVGAPYTIHLNEAPKEPMVFKSAATQADLSGLKARADRAGVVYSNSDGDEPGVAMNRHTATRSFQQRSAICCRSLTIRS